jgi:hypothetical protein
VAAIGTVMMLLAGCGGNAATQSPAPSTPTPVPTTAPTPSAGLFVDAGSDKGPISPLVYGTNTGPWLAVPFALQDKIAAMKLRTITFPGGNWGDQNDLETYQIDTFIAYCRQIGAEPRIVVRLKGGTTQKAADLVTYVNVTMKYNVKYWGVGNETDLYSANDLPDYTVDQYNKDWREFAQAMLKVDPKIVLVGPDVSQFVGDQSDSDYLKARTAWLTSFLHANGDLVGIVSIHRYAFPNNAAQTPPTIADMRDNSKEWDTIIPALRQIIHDQTGKDLPIAVTEVNSSYSSNAGGAATMDSQYEGIWFADVLGRLIKQKVTMVDQFALAGDWGIVGANDVHPLYYTYMMYNMFGTELVNSVSDDPLVQIYAAKRTDGTLTLMIVNLGDTAATEPLTIVGGGSAATAETWLFDASHTAEKVASTALGGSVTVPPASVTLLVVGK